MRIKQIETTSKVTERCRNKILEHATKIALEFNKSKEILSDDEFTELFTNEWPNWLSEFDSKNSIEVVSKAFYDELYVTFNTNELKRLLKLKPGKYLLRNLKNSSFRSYTIVLEEGDLANPRQNDTNTMHNLNKEML